MKAICEVLKSLPKELEEHILKDLHSYNLYKINQKIKYEVDSFGECDMDGGVIYEYWFNIGLKQLPKKYWTKIKKHHKRYMDNYKWMLHERWGVEYEHGI